MTQMAEKGLSSQSGDRVSQADPIPTLAETLLTCIDQRLARL